MIKNILSNWLIPASVLVLTLLAAFFFGGGWAGVIVACLFCITLGMAISAIVAEQKKAYREKRITRTRMILNVLSEITLILLAMTSAALLGRWIAEIATQQIGNQLIRFIAGMVISLLAGMGVGFLVKQTWGRLTGR